MKAVKLPKENVSEFMQATEKTGEIWGPVRRKSGGALPGGAQFAGTQPGDAHQAGAPRVGARSAAAQPAGSQLGAVKTKTPDHIYGRVSDFSELEPAVTRTVIPAKIFFHPPHFNMFKFSEHGYCEELRDVASRIVVGLHPCDIHALLILDRLFSRDFPDPYWIMRREKTVVIGHSCLPDEKCFCHSTGTDVVEEGFDLFFSDLDEFYLVWIGSSKGDDLIRLRPDLFIEKLERKDIERFIEWKKWRDGRFKLNLDFTALPDLMELMYNDAIWEDIALSCLSCASCSMVCPTCNCYNVSDHYYVHNDEGERTRFWDSCMLKEYSLVAGGHNFRPKRADRLKLWYTHKLQAFMSAFGKYACVGCGRCILTCPVEINVETVARTLRGEPVEAFWKRLALKGAK
ncbi:MAG: 4Fe-4S dicluster domain-containing protein [Candidatus Eisenbacteria bacterium]